MAAWSIAELREAMVEAGIAATEVYADFHIAPGQSAMADLAHLGEGWIVVVVGRV